jgi:hypothetical protein
MLNMSIVWAVFDTQDISWCVWFYITVTGCGYTDYVAFIFGIGDIEI